MDAPGTIPALHGAVLRDRDGAAVGPVDAVLVDHTNNRPAWFVVRVEGRRTVVPAAGSRPGVRGPRAAVWAFDVAACPVTLEGVALRRDQVVAACRHYGVRPPAGAFADAVLPAGPPVLARHAVAAVA